MHFIRFSVRFPRLDPLHSLHRNPNDNEILEPKSDFGKLPPAAESVGEQDGWPIEMSQQSTRDKS